MKKSLLSLSLLICLVTYSQSRLKFSAARDEKGKQRTSSSCFKYANPFTVTGSITSNNNYVPGSTMNLSFTLITDNLDNEYIDSLSITFPAGFTINGTSANPFFPTEDNGGGDEAFNGISGQTITWGSHVANTDNWGGIWAPTGVTFDINVTIGSVSGPQTINFFAKGDEYPGTLGQTNGDMSGSITVLEASASDLKAISADVPSGCNLSANEQVTMWLVNFGTAPATGFDLKYIVNGGTPVVETYTATTVNPGDTLMYTFSTPLNMTAPMTYSVWTITSVSGDGDMNNDSAYVEGNSWAALTFPYSTGFENAPATDLEGWTAQDVDGGGDTWAVTTLGPHPPSAQCVRCFEQAAGASEDWLFSQCMDFTGGNTYKISWWQRLNAGAEGSLGISTGSFSDAAAMTTSILPLNPLAADGIWRLDSTTFVAAASGTYYLGWQAVNTNASAQLVMRLDDINITDLGVISGLSESSGTSFSIYPNPSSGKFMFSLVQPNTRMEVFSITGERVFSCGPLAKGNNQIDLSFLAGGYYFFKIAGDQGVESGKITIAR